VDCACRTLHEARAAVSQLKVNSPWLRVQWNPRSPSKHSRVFLLCFVLGEAALVLTCSDIALDPSSARPWCHIDLKLWLGSVYDSIHCFDLRNPSNPLFVFKSHPKAVSYVKLSSPNELASASTDSTLRLWDVQTNCCVRSYQTLLLSLHECALEDLAYYVCAFAKEWVAGECLWLRQLHFPLSRFMECERPSWEKTWHF